MRIIEPSPPIVSSVNNENWLRSTTESGHIVNISFSAFDKVESVSNAAFGEIFRAYWKSAEKMVTLKCPHTEAENSFGDFVNKVIYFTLKSLIFMLIS